MSTNQTRGELMFGSPDICDLCSKAIPPEGPSVSLGDGARAHVACPTESPAPTDQTWWMVGSNLIGCLPESEPVMFQDWRDARDYYGEEMERLGDHFYMNGDRSQVDAVDKALLWLPKAAPGESIADDIGYVRYWLIAHRPAILECDRCARPSVVLTVDEYDEIVDTDPGLEYEPGRVLLRCTAWPSSVLSRIEG